MGNQEKRTELAEPAIQVVDQAQLRAVVSTVRHDILDQVSAFGPLAVSDIAGLLGASASSLYYHIEQLLAVGLLVEDGSRPTARKPEKLYSTPARRMRMLEALQDPANHSLIGEQVGAITKRAARDFAQGLRSPHRCTLGEGRNLRFARLMARPDPATLARINAHLDAITTLLEESARGSGERLAFSWIVSPHR